MNDPAFEKEYEYPYDEYPEDVGVTSVGLPPGQLALIIGVNAVISLIISISVVLIANRQTVPAEVASLLTKTPTVQAGESAPPAPGVETESGAEAPPPVTPVETVTYIVEEGDTLSLIAEKFSVSVSDLMVANGLTNKDFIQIGQELIIPVGGLPRVTPTFTPMVLPTDTPLPFEPPTPLPANAQIPAEPAVIVGPSPTPTPTPVPTSTPPPIDEIKVVVSEVIAPGDLLRETLVIFNQGAGTSLKDWKLEGSPLGVFVFPDIFLFSGGSIRIHTAAGENTPSDLYLNQGEAAWPPGTKIILSDANNIEISTFVVP